MVAEQGVDGRAAGAHLVALAAARDPGHACAVGNQVVGTASEHGAVDVEVGRGGRIVGDQTVLRQDVARTDLEPAAVGARLVFDDGRVEDCGRGRTLQGDGAAVGGRVAGQGRFEQVEPAGGVGFRSCNSDSSDVRSRPRTDPEP